MLELESLAYIDLQKTGSTTIISILQNLGENRVYKKSHGRIPDSFEEGKFTFVSVREPLSLLTSLFTFGACEKRGLLYEALTLKGYWGLYEPNLRGFERWLDFVTDPARSKQLERNYGDFPVSQDIGLMSFRLLYMSVPMSRFELRNLAPGRRNVSRLLKRSRVYNDYVRTEHLAADLFALLLRHQKKMGLKLPFSTVEQLEAQMPKKNASTKITGVNTQAISTELRQRVIDREWLVYKEFGYRQAPTGLPSKENSRFNVR